MHYSGAQGPKWTVVAPRSRLSERGRGVADREGRVLTATQPHRVGVSDRRVTSSYQWAGTDREPHLHCKDDEMRAHGQLVAHFFGAFRLTIDGVAVDMASSRRTRNLLAYLIMHRRAPVPRDVLMDVFWPAVPMDTARNRLNVAISGARQTLRAATPHPVIQRWPGAYWISDTLAVWADADEFERACAAGRRAEHAGDQNAAMRFYQATSDLYNGVFLADEPYADWAAARREALAMEAVEAQRRLMEIHIDRGDHSAAVLVGRRVLLAPLCVILLPRVHKVALFTRKARSSASWAEALPVDPTHRDVRHGTGS
jgi:hypothetical protein